MTTQNPHTYTCPGCGRVVSTAAGHHARQKSPCLSCVRQSNGWEHKAWCDLEPDHRDQCPMPPGVGL